MDQVGGDDQIVVNELRAQLVAGMDATDLRRRKTEAANAFRQLVRRGKQVLVVNLEELMHGDEQWPDDIPMVNVRLDQHDIRIGQHVGHGLAQLAPVTRGQARLDGIDWSVRRFCLDCHDRLLDSLPLAYASCMTRALPSAH